jgi:hypothetical protein
MLDKVKRYVNVSNDDIPPEKTCLKLTQITCNYTGEEITPQEAIIEYVKCNALKEEVLINTDSSLPPSITIDDCIIEDSLYVNNVQILTSPQSITDWEIITEYEDCGSKCSLFIIDVSGEVVFLDCSNKLVTLIFNSGDQLCAKSILNSNGHSLISLCP